MNAIRIETTVDEHGELHLTKLPFSAGESVEITVVSQRTDPRTNKFPLRGMPIIYEGPTDPIAGEDWDILR